MSRTGAASGLLSKGDIRGLGHVGGALHPVGNGRPVRLGYGLDDIPHALVLADGDGEADIQLSAGGDHGMGVEAAVGSQREWSGGSGVAHPSHRLTQEVRRRPEPCWFGPGAADTSARRRCPRLRPTVNGGGNAYHCGVVKPYHEDNA